MVVLVSILDEMGWPWDDRWDGHGMGWDGMAMGYQIGCQVGWDGMPDGMGWAGLGSGVKYDIIVISTVSTNLLICRV